MYTTSLQSTIFCRLKSIRISKAYDTLRYPNIDLAKIYVRAKDDHSKPTSKLDLWNILCLHTLHILQQNKEATNTY